MWSGQNLDGPQFVTQTVIITRTHNPGVGGSNPPPDTQQFKGLRLNTEALFYWRGAFGDVFHIKGDNLGYSDFLLFSLSRLFHLF